MLSNRNVILILMGGLYLWTIFATPVGHPYGLLSLAPVIMAVALSFITKNAILSLLCGLFSASLILTDSPIEAAYYLLDPFLLDAISDKDNMKVIVFSLLVSIMVEFLRTSGGTKALVASLSRLASNRRAAMTSTWFAGLVVFFDDYANCLIVGSSMSDVTDKAKVSREKLAYIVDSTAAPVATLALISTWIGYEVSLMDKALKSAGETVNAYSFFLEGLPYRFYPILALVFGLGICLTGRDFGPMRTAEEKAQRITTIQKETVKPEIKVILTAVIPILTLIGFTAYDLYAQGVAVVGPSADLFKIIGEADGYDAMLKGAFCSVFVAALLSIWAGEHSKELLNSAKRGSSRLGEALCVLVCAWAIGSAIGELQAAEYMIEALDNKIPTVWFPAIVFLLAAVIAFSTGTSFGTMGTLMPLAIPLCIEANADPIITVAVSAAVLSGATWGDHCSPISDTTVLSSAGAGCDHVEHVRTQMPYALSAGIISLLCCSVPVGFGIHWLPCLLVGSMACLAVIFILGKKPQTA
jgi:Na+/H+ antiporter NhaC